MSIYGELDTTTQCLKRTADTLGKDWVAGKVRMRKEDVARARKYLKEINKQSKQIAVVLKKFDGIVLLNDGGTIETLSFKSDQ